MFLTSIYAGLQLPGHAFDVIDQHLLRAFFTYSSSHDFLMLLAQPVDVDF
jgi:hypothetical protein